MMKMVGNGTRAAALAGVLAAAVMALTMAPSAASAATGTYTISGQTNGSFNGTPFTNEGFVFTLVADHLTEEPDFEFSDPLVSATVTLNGIGTFTVEQPTSLGTLSGGETALDQYEPNQRNIFIWDLATPVNLNSSFAPVASTLTEIVGDVIPTSGGDLQFNGTGASATPVLTLAGTVVGNLLPEPDSWTMMLLGFGLCGAALRARRGLVTQKALNWNMIGAGQPAQ
jgi:hypothetical protein